MDMLVIEMDPVKVNIPLLKWPSSPHLKHAPDDIFVSAEFVFMLIVRFRAP